MIILKRSPERDGGTFGIFLTPGFNAICVSMELPWLNNQHNISCIPAGEYQLEQFTHEKLGQVFRVLNVPDRDGILIHGANWIDQLRGCVAPGMDYGIPDGKIGIVDSQKALTLLRAINPTTLQIVNP